MLPVKVGREVGGLFFVVVSGFVILLVSMDLFFLLKKHEAQRERSLRESRSIALIFFFSFCASSRFIGGNRDRGQVRLMDDKSIEVIEARHSV